VAPGRPKKATAVLHQLDQACRPLVTAIALDEIFFRATPVLMGVCPHSFAWVVGHKGPDRAGDTWAAALAGFDAVQRVVSDGGLGLAKGVTALQQRQQALGRPVCSVGLDLFHLKRDAYRVLRQVWQQADAVWEAEAKADRRRPIHQGVRRSALPVRPVRAKAEAAYTSAERQQQAWTRIAMALEVFRPDGRLNDRAWADGEIAAARAGLLHTGWKKVKRALDDPRALQFLDDLQAAMAQAVPDPAVRAAVVERWRLRHGGGARTAAGVIQEAVQTLVCAKQSPDWGAAYERVREVLGRAVRASSAVECVNSVLRMHQARQRNVGQGMLDLKRLWWNTRPFREGKRKRKSPYELLGLINVADFWQVLTAATPDLARCLGIPPTTENLSTS
jgi:hypothetical protein